MLLDEINKTGDIKNIPKSKYPELAQEIREYLINIGIKKGNDELRNDLNASLAKLTQARRSEMMGAASQRSAA